MPTINFAGLASGIDSNALIDAMSEAARQGRVKPNEKEISQLEETNSAFDELKTKLITLENILYNKFATKNGGTVDKIASSTDETKVTARATPAAVNGSYLVTVSAIAKNHTQSYDADRFASTSEVLAPLINNGDPILNRTVTYSVGIGSEQVDIDVVIDSSTTVESFITSFNGNPDNAGRATASAVNVGSPSTPSYAIVITTNNEGTQKGQITSITVGASVSAQGIFTGASSEEPATDAEFTISGISGTITRSSNKVTDVIAGVTLELAAIGPATITISEDAAKTTAKVQDMIDAYNDIVKFINESNTITREENGEDVENIFGPLAESRTDDNALFSLRGAISGSTYASGSQIKIFADLGITTDRDGTLLFNTDEFAEAVADEPSSVNEILMNFGDLAGLTTGVIHQYTRAVGLIETAVSGNQSLITNLNDRIAQAEQSIAKQEELMRQRFARLESIVGKLQQQQSALTSALSGLG